MEHAQISCYRVYTCHTGYFGNSIILFQKVILNLDFILFDTGTLHVTNLRVMWMSFEFTRMNICKFIFIAKAYVDEINYFSIHN